MYLTKRYRFKKPGCCGSEGAEAEGKALDLPVHLHPNPQLWSLALGSDRTNEIADTSGQNELPRVPGLSLRERVRSSALERVRSSVLERG